MAVESRAQITREEYLALERASELKHEYVAGRMIAMAGVSPLHCEITVNTMITLALQMRPRPGKVYATNLRVVIPALNSYVYPDVMVVRDEPQFDDGDGLLNPTTIVEVLSPLTEQYDRGRKFLRYQRIASFREYVLIRQDMPWIERFARQPDGQWLWSATEGMSESVSLVSIGCTLALADVYDKLVFDGPPADPDAVE